MKQTNKKILASALIPFALKALPFNTLLKGLPVLSSEQAKLKRSRMEKVNH